MVTGAAGMLGTVLVDQLAERHDVMATDRKVGYQRPGVRWVVVDLLSEGALYRLLVSERPDLVIHAAAIVNVDVCERDPATAMRVHSTVVEEIGEAIGQWGGAMIYISTDAVFDGGKVGLYVEADLPRPLNVYSHTKLQGEAACLASDRGTVLRTNIIGWSRADKLSFAEWVLRGLIEGSELAMFADVSFTPLHTAALSNVIEDVWERQAFGLFHAAGQTALSKFEFALLMADEFGLAATNITSRSVGDARLDAMRPRNMALRSDKLRSALGYSALPTAAESVQAMQQQYNTGWVSRVKGRRLSSDYRFWESA